MFSKKSLLAGLIIFCIAALPVLAQESEEETNPHANTKLISVNLLGPIFGVYTGSFEFPVAEKLTVAIQPVYMNFRYSLASLLFNAVMTEEELEQFDFNLTSYGGQISLNYFPEGVHNGFMVGGFGGYNLLTVSSGGYSVNTNLYNGGMRVGYRKIFGFIAVTPYAQAEMAFSTTDAADIYAELGIDDETLQNSIGNSFGFNFGYGIALAIAF